MSGCQQAAIVIPPEPPSPQPAPIEKPQPAPIDMQINIPSSTIASIFMALGAENSITLSKPLVFKKDPLVVSIPAGASTSWSLTPEGGTFTFNHPKPVASVTKFGFTIHPTLDRVDLVPEDKAEIHATWLGKDWTETVLLSLDGVGEEAVPARVEAEELVPEPDPMFELGPAPKLEEDVLPKKPVVYMWSLDVGCVPCNNAKKAFKDATDLPFEVEFVAIDTPRVQKGEQVPYFEWEVEGKTQWQLGWLSLPDFLKVWKKSQEKRVPRPDEKVAFMEDIGS